MVSRVAIPVPGMSPEMGNVHVLLAMRENGSVFSERRIAMNRKS